MKCHLPLALAILAGGCAPGPTVSKGTFNTPYTLTLQRDNIEIVVQTSGTASYTITNYSMDHPMGKRPDTEAVFTTPAGVFTISDKGQTGGVLINNVFYPHNAAAMVRTTITIDPKGAVTSSTTPLPGIP